MCEQPQNSQIIRHHLEIQSYYYLSMQESYCFTVH